MNQKRQISLRVLIIAAALFLGVVCDSSDSTDSSNQDDERSRGDYETSTFDQSHFDESAFGP